MGLLDAAVATALPLLPRALVGRFARPYIAGETLDRAALVVQSLMDEGAMATLDVLGEEVSSAEEASALADAYAEALALISERDLDSNVSVKLSGLGFRLDPSMAEASLRRLVALAGDLGNFVRIAMEDSSMTDGTLEVYRRLRADHDNLGVVLQASLHRTLEDAERLVPLGVNARVVKGIYVEPEHIALRGRRVVQDAFMALVETLLAGGCYVAIATHDRELVERSLDLVERLGLDRDRYEMQMLLGVAPALRRELLEAGHRLRVYVPFGAAWHAYSVRRLRENPAMAGHVLRALLLGPG